MKTQESHRAMRNEWRRERAKDAFREAQLDEERLAKLEYDLATRKQLDHLRAMKEASRLYKKGG